MDSENGTILTNKLKWEHKVGQLESDITRTQAIHGKRIQELLTDINTLSKNIEKIK